MTMTLSGIAIENRKKADDSFKNCNYLDACEYYFYAGEAFGKYGEELLSAECYKKSFISNIKSSEILKDFPVEEYLDSMEAILLREKRFDLLENNFLKIEIALKDNGYYSLSSKYYLKMMIYRKKLFKKNGKISLWIAYNLWQYSSKYGESFCLWFISLSAVAFVYSIIFWPAPYKFMESIDIKNDMIPLENSFDYWFFSLITFAPWDWNYIIPLNTFGKLIIASRLFLGSIMFGLLLNLISKKFLRR